MGCGASTVQPDDTQTRVLNLERELERERAQRAAERAERLEQEVAELRAREQEPTHSSRTGRSHRRSSSDSAPPPSQDVAAEPTQEQEPTFTPFWTEGRKRVFKGVIQGGVKAIWALCQEYKSVLPFPGGPGVALIGQIAELLGTALANKDNLESLLHRALELMDLIIEKHVSKEELDANVKRRGGSTKKGSRVYCNLMERLRDLLEEIMSYSRSYCDRNFILKLLMTSYDRDQHSDLADRLARLMVDAHFSVSVDTHTMTVEVHAMSTEMKEMLASVRSAMPYVDHTSEVKRMVESLGGMDAVLGSEAKVEQVAKHLDHGQQITIAMLSNQVQASLLAAMAKNDVGVHTIIRNTDMRTFWRQFFNGVTKVEWDMWWCVFPARLHDVVKDKEVVDKVVSCLSTDGCMAQFQAYVERSDPDTLSVREIELAFPTGSSILDVVEQALTSEQGGNAIEASTHSQSDGATQRPRPLLRQPSLAAKGVRCLLPQLGKEYTGREKDAAALEELMTQQSSTAAVCIIAGAGHGKSTLSIDVGWRLTQAGLCPSGAVMVDMREAGSFEAALGRVCGVLDVTMDDHAAKSVSTQLAACHRKHGGPLLLLLDNAEDPAGGADGAQFEAFVAEMARNAMLLITSRMPVAPAQGVQQYNLGTLDAAAARSLLLSVASNLEEIEAAEATDLCGGVPLLLRRVGDALLTGQIVIEDLKAAAAASADQTSSILNLTLCTLPRQQQLQLSQLAVFPSGFKEDDAAAVLGCDEARASGLLAVLFRHGLVTRDLHAGTSGLHAAVREAAANIGGVNVKTAQERFVVHVLTKLGQWAQLFFSPAWELPLSLAREAGADILAAFELAGKLTSQPGSLPESLLTAILAMDAAQVETLLSYAGHHKSTWSQLQHLHSHLQSDSSSSREQLAAAAFLRFLAASMDVSDKQRWDTAHSAAHEALQLCTACYGADNPQTHACIHALGESCSGLIKYAEAEECFRQAYEARLRMQGVQAPGTLESMFGLASCLYCDQGLPHKAEPLYRELHSHVLVSLGPLHPLSSKAGNGLANCVSDLGKLDDAELLYRDALEGRNHILGDSHPHTLESINNLANCLGNQGKLGDAEALHRDALEARKKVLGDSHPDTLVSINKLAGCLKIQGKLSDAEPLFRDALEARKRMLGGSHPRTLDSINNLASCLKNQGKFSDAEALYHDALEARKCVLGDRHPRTLESINNLANCLGNQGKLGDAEALHRDALEARKQVLGDSHPHTLLSINNLAECLEKQGKEQPFGVMV